MAKNFYRMTATARNHLKMAVRDTKRIWGGQQAKKYATEFLAGLQHIADNHQRLHSAHRCTLTEGTDFSIYLVQHRYVAYQPYGQDCVIITGIFHEKMDLPARLKELQRITRQEIDAVKREIEGSKSTPH
jgi:plasmid stabilization system protein ParE